MVIAAAAAQWASAWQQSDCRRARWRGATACRRSGQPSRRRTSRPCWRPIPTRAATPRLSAPCRAPLQCCGSCWTLAASTPLRTRPTQALATLSAARQMTPRARGRRPPGTSTLQRPRSRCHATVWSRRALRAARARQRASPSAALRRLSARVTCAWACSTLSPAPTGAGCTLPAGVCPARCGWGCRTPTPALTPPASRPRC
mmetsp:Transcript_8686/g.22347  ORF Transcript_8686/g.22347 Transcript_8686/m.22347 type:complete len:202 (+) Transcript_8686:410-1015(+)